MPRPITDLLSTEASLEGGESTDDTEVPGENAKARDEVSPLDEEDEDVSFCAIACARKSVSEPGMISSASASAV